MLKACASDACGMDDEILDAAIIDLLRAYGAAAIPIDKIARTLDLGDDDAGRQRAEERLVSLAEEGHVRRSRVFADRWVAAA
jgi:hypothetical protein